MKRLQLLSPSRVLFASCLMLFFSASVFAQESTEPVKRKTMTIRITEDVNGEVTEKVIELPADADFDLEETLEGLEIQKEIDEMAAEENIEIIIRKNELDQELKELSIELERELGNLEIELNGEMERLQEHLAKLKVEMENMPKRPLLGVHFEMTSDGSMDKGAEITKIVPQSGADKAGLKAGDIITAVDGQTINSIEELPNIIGEYAPGDEVEVAYLRDGKSDKTLATLGEGGGNYGGMRMMKFHGDDADFDFDFDFDEEGGNHHFKWKGDCDDANVKVITSGEKRVLLGIIPESDAKKRGVIVEEVLKNTTAAEMNLKSGDIVTAINGNKVTNTSELREQLSQVKEGDSYSVDFLRDDVPLQASGSAKMSEGHGGRTKVVTCKSTCDGKKGSRTETRVIKIMIDMDEVSEEETEALSKANENFNTDNSLSPSELKLYPNPNNGKFKLDLELEDNSPVTFRVYDQLGVQVYAETVADFNGGNLSREVDISNEAKGVYFLQITQNGKSTTRKVVTE